MPAKVEEVRSYLDIREINGYSMHYTTFQPADATKPPIQTLVYIGTPDNPQFVGAQDPQELAEHISRSRGPSGENKEYLFMLEKSLEELCSESTDEHVNDLAARVRKIEAGKDLVNRDEVSQDIEGPLPPNGEIKTNHL